MFALFIARVLPCMVMIQLGCVSNTDYFFVQNYAINNNETMLSLHECIELQQYCKTKCSTILKLKVCNAYKSTQLFLTNNKCCNNEKLLHN